MSPLGPGELRARRRPFVVLLLALARLALGACLAFPLASLIAASGIGRRLEGDAALFADGGYFLLELLRLRGADLAAALRGLLPLWLAGLVLTLAGNTALLVALNVGGRLVVRDWLGATLRYLPRLLVLSLATLLAQGLLLGAFMLAGAALPERLTSARQHDLGLLALLCLGAALAGALGGLSDVTRASVIRHDAPLARAFDAALACARRKPLASCFGWLPYAACALLALVAASRLTSALDVSRPGAGRVLGVFAVHQLVIVLGLWLRAVWFARALRLCAVHALPATRRAPAGRAERSAAPLGPMTRPPASRGA